MKKAVILFNLGGPDSLEAVQPFLFNLFFDPAIIRLPMPLRYLVAKLISTRRAPKTQEIYKHIGNKSPLLELTNAQASALENTLNDGDENTHYRCFTAMRYWHPFASEVVAEVKNFHPDEVILLPLYPQFSTTTSESSLKDWKKQAKKHGLNVSHKTMGCYPFESAFIRAHADLIMQELKKLPDTESVRILFSAHGLPEKIIDAGDPYQWQVEQTVKHTVDALQEALLKTLDVAISYQSRVGPLKWIGPSTEDEITRAGRDGKTLILTPIAFVSEHSETLVELDIEYKHLADVAGVKNYIRVPALGTHPDFIRSLKNLCLQAGKLEDDEVASASGQRLCPAEFKQCLCYPQA